LRSTRSSAEGSGPRRLTRGAIVALVVVSLAIPAAILGLILATNDSGGVDPTQGPIVAPKRAKIGEVAPDFTLPGLDAKRLTLSGLRGRAVVLTFFASWCNPCERDMPILERAQRENGDRIAVVGVNYRDFPVDTRTFVRRLGVTFPTLLEDSADNKVAARYDVNSIPDTVFIDARGVVRDRLYGPATAEELQSAVDSLLGHSSQRK
jgi:cytochrome c biogenesis protein CcmG, thiol:disulfide interchange protein DsbE